MARTGFLPSEAQRQTGSANVISQGGSQVGQVTPGTNPPALSAALQNEDASKGGWQATPTSATAGMLLRSSGVAASRMLARAKAGTGENQSINMHSVSL